MSSAKDHREDIQTHLDGVRSEEWLVLEALKQRDCKLALRHLHTAARHVGALRAHLVGAKDIDATDSLFDRVAGVDRTIERLKERVKTCVKAV